MMIELRPFQKNDFPFLKECINSTSAEFMIKWGGSNFSFPLTDDRLEEYVAETENSSNPAYIFTACRNGSMEPAGHIAVRKIDLVNKSARIGKVLIAEKYRGKGYAREMLIKALEFCFDELHLHRVSLGVFENNQHPFELYKKIGFQTEGLIRDFRLVNDEYWSLYEMSMLEYEWKNLYKY